MGWKYNSFAHRVTCPHNGITFVQGETWKIGEDPFDVCRWFCARDCINHTHHRHVEMRVPR